MTIFECIARGIVLGPRNSPKYLLNNLACIFATFAYIIFFIMYTISKTIGSMFVTLHFALCFMLIYHYSLPAFLLLLVYPTKVIIIVTCLIAFVFTAIVLCSVPLLMWRPIILYVALKHKHICVKVGMHLVHALYILLSPTTIILLFVVLFQLVYALMLIQPSSITNGPVYTVLSLIPSAAISLIS